MKRAKDLEAKKRRKAERKAKRAGSAADGSSSTQAEHQEVTTQSSVAATPVAFVFPGQGSQAVGMLPVSPAAPHIPVHVHNVLSAFCICCRLEPATHLVAMLIAY